MFHDVNAYPDVVLQVPAGETLLTPAGMFGEHMPLEVDLGSGKGRFLLARAAAYPGVGFLGVERQKRRVVKVAKKANRAGLTNIRLLHDDIAGSVANLLPDRAVRCFYLFYPDPWPKRRHHGRRLMQPAFLALLHRKLAPGGLIHFATDHVDYFGAVRRLFAEDARFEPSPPFLPLPEEQTDFELLFAAQGQHANRLSLRKPA